MKTALTAGVLVSLLAVAGVFGVRAWMAAGDAQISTSGYIAMALGVVFTVALGVGLMALVFFSHRRGYDDVDIRED